VCCGWNVHAKGAKGGGGRGGSGLKGGKERGEAVKVGREAKQMGTVIKDIEMERRNTV